MGRTTRSSRQLSPVFQVAHSFIKYKQRASITAKVAIYQQPFPSLFLSLLYFSLIIKFITTQMEAQQTVEPIPSTKSKKTHVLVRTWQEFTDRAMDLLIQNPTQSKFVLKYVPKTHKFILKVSDGSRLVMRKCKGDQLDEVQKFTTFAGRALTNEGNKKVEEKVGVEDKDKKRKNKKKR